MDVATSHRAHIASPRRSRPRQGRLLTALGILLAAIVLALGGFLVCQRAPRGVEATTPEGEAIVEACHEVPSPGENLCAAWVSEVYERALGRYPTGNANDMYEQLASIDRADLMPGMALAVSTHPHTEAGRQYGHIGIYIGDGLVMDNVGEIRTTSLDWWLRHYGATVPVRWGWLC